MGPLMIAFLQGVYERTKAAGKFEMRQQSELHYSWNTMVASSFWDMRLSVACVATDAEYQNRIIQRDRTLNLPVVARQPHPDPNFAPHAARRAACRHHRGLVPKGTTRRRARRARRERRYRRARRVQRARWGGNSAQGF